jgi:hypothetical protein
MESANGVLRQLCEFRHVPFGRFRGSRDGAEETFKLSVPRMSVAKRNILK